MSISKKDADIINIKQFTHMFVRNWFWFFISISFSLFMVFLINRYSHSSFQSSTRILIQSDKKSANSISKMLYDTDQFKLETSLNDEMMILKSYPLIYKTIEELEFDIVYYLIGDVIIAETYNYFAKVDFHNNLKPYGLEFSIIPLSQNQFSLRSDILKDSIYSFGDTIRYNNTSFTVNLNPDFNLEKKIEQYLPSKVKVRNPQNIAREYKSNLVVE